jgi:hypothetical protein
MKDAIALAFSGAKFFRRATKAILRAARDDKL